jgi:acyl-CoA thioesterase-1
VAAFVVVVSLVSIGAATLGQPSTARPVVVAIGDSIMEGHGLPNGQAWVDLVAARNGWNFTNLASDGSGFDTTGNAGDTFDDQVTDALALRPVLIIISGSSNDLDAGDPLLTQRTSDTIERIRDSLPASKIVAVSALWGASTPPAQLSAIDRQVEAAVRFAHGSFVAIGQPLQGHPELMQSDGVHPTTAGHRFIELRFLQAVRVMAVPGGVLDAFFLGSVPPR